MKNLKQAEIYIISGGACKTEVTAMTSEANEYTNNMPKPIPGTCTIKGDINIPGFKNMGGMISGGNGFNIQSGGIKFVCKCSEEYSNDTFIINIYKEEL